MPSLSGKKGSGSITSVRNVYNIDTSDANALASDILLSKTAYVNGVKLTGTLTLDGNATPSDVLSGKTFYSSDRTKRTGAVPIVPTTTYTPTTTDQFIQPKQYVETQTILGDADLVAGNIKDGVTIFGVEGIADFVEEGITYTVSGGNIVTASVYGNYIPPKAFRYYQFLHTVTLPDSITTIYDETFYNCGALELANLPSSLMSIGNGAFRYCDEVEFTSLPNNITNIGNYAFDGCTIMPLASLPIKLLNIGTHAFKDCLAITSLALPSGLLTIGGNAFDGCTNITKIWIPSTCTTISSVSAVTSPFYNCSSTLHIYCEIASKPNGWNQFWRYYSGTAELTVTWNTTLAQFNAL